MACTHERKDRDCTCWGVAMSRPGDVGYRDQCYLVVTGAECREYGNRSEAEESLKQFQQCWPKNMYALSFCRRVEHVQPVACYHKPASTCLLGWCLRPVAEHSDEELDRCGRFYDDTVAINKKHDDYLVGLLRTKATLLSEPRGDDGSWRRYAAERRDIALASLQQRFYSLRWVPTGGMG